MPKVGIIILNKIQLISLGLVSPWNKGANKSSSSIRILGLKAYKSIQIYIYISSSLRLEFKLEYDSIDIQVEFEFCFFFYQAKHKLGIQRFD